MLTSILISSAVAGELAPNLDLVPPPIIRMRPPLRLVPPPGTGVEAEEGAAVLARWMGVFRLSPNVCKIGGAAVGVLIDWTFPVCTASPEDDCLVQKDGSAFPAKKEKKGKPRPKAGTVDDKWIFDENFQKEWFKAEVAYTRSLGHETGSAPDPRFQRLTKSKDFSEAFNKLKGRRRAAMARYLAEAQKGNARCVEATLNYYRKDGNLEALADLVLTLASYGLFD